MFKDKISEKSGIVKKVYCIFCGEENNNKEQKCKKCKRKLNPKSHLFRNYVIDKCRGDVSDTIFKSIIKFIKTKLYGITLSASIIASATVIITNAVTNNYITELKEEPKFSYASKQYNYLGEGLSTNEVINKYLEFVKNGDLESANGLIAENFLSDDELAMIPFDRANNKYYNKIKHDFIEYNNKFFKHINPNEGVSLFTDEGIGRFNNLYYNEPEVVRNDRFSIGSNYIELSYCLSNDCNNDTQFTLMEVLETISVNNKVYILSEYAFLTDNYSRVVRYIFDNNNGNLKDINNDKFYEIMDSCLDDNGTVICNLPLPKYGDE